MNIVFLGALVLPEQVPQMSGVSVAGNQFQYNMIKCLAKHEKVHIYVLSALPLAPFPRDKRIMIRKTRRKLWDNVEYFEIPYINIPIIKQLTQIRGFISCAKRLLNIEPVLLSMNLYPHTGCAFLKLLQRHGLKGAAILADLPIDDDYTRKGLSRVFRRWYYGIAAQNIKKCHDLIVLNKNAINEYADPSAHYIVMEGGIALDEVGEFERSERDDGRKRVVYSGALTDYSGIRELIEAMKYVANDNIILEIYGSGKHEKEVKESVEKSRNIVFGGRVSREEMLKIQSEAWLLVNPRPMDDPIARVTFPSKIFEYMVSGTPVLSTRLNGFTDEYYDKMFFVDSNEPSVMGQRISEIAMMDDLQLSEMAIKARQFVLEKKNWQCQTEKMYKFLADL